MQTFNITPKPRMLIGVQNQRWNVSGALAELIDNAFGPGRGNAGVVKITYDATDRTLTVEDDGQGMDYIGQLFQLGNTIGHTAGDIGHFGSGGTQAIIWLPEWVRVATQRNNKVMMDRIRWSEIFAMEDFRDVAVSNEWKKGHLSALGKLGHGTIIHMKLLKARKINTSNVIRDLSRLFAPGLRHGKQIIWCQQRSGEVIEERQLDDPFEATSQPENTVRFDIVIDRDGEHLPVHGVVLFNENTSHADSLIRVGFGYREIMRTRDCFKSEDEAFAGIGVSGWLDLGEGWQPYLSTTKDTFNDQPLYDALMLHVFEKIRALLLRAEQQTVDFELDNLAIGLEIALEKTMKMKVTVTRDPGPNPDPGPGPNPNPEPSTHKPIPDPEGDEEAPATARIRLVKQDDDDMMGALARAGDDPLGIYVDINQEHVYVREAMRQRPINSAALNLMIITEIAALLAEKKVLAQNAFKKSVLDELDRREGHEKVRMLVRHMIDSVPDKQQRATE
jgi:Histidine kinase-, DNA gyrase B-, and HSP90-like ATPase